MKFYIKQKVFSLKDNFDVFDEQQNPVYKVSGKFFSMKNKMELSNLNGDVLLSSEKKVFSFRPTYFIFDQHGTQIAKVKQKFSLRPKFEVNIYNQAAEISGNFFQRTFDVNVPGGVAASIRKKVFSFGDSYEIEINDTENTEIYLYLVIVIDQVLHERENKGNND